MGRQPNDKAKPKHRKGLWSPEEDNKLRNYIVKHGHGCWSSVPINAGLFLLSLPSSFDSSSSSQKPAIPISDHFSASQNYNFIKEAGQSSLPKLLFAEWLSLDQANSGIPANSGDDPFVFGNGSFDQYSDFHEAAMHVVSEGGSYVEEFDNGLTTLNAAAATEVSRRGELHIEEADGGGAGNLPTVSGLLLPKMLDISSVTTSMSCLRFALSFERLA